METRRVRVRWSTAGVLLALQIAQPWSGRDHVCAAFTLPLLRGGQRPRAGITIALASGNSKKKSKGAGDVGAFSVGASPMARPSRSEAAILSDVKAAVAKVGVGFDASAQDLERVASLLGDLEDYNGIVPV